MKSQVNLTAAALLSVVPVFANLQGPRSDRFVGLRVSEQATLTKSRLASSFVGNAKINNRDIFAATNVINNIPIIELHHLPSCLCFNQIPRRFCSIRPYVQAYSSIGICWEDYTFETLLPYEITDFNIRIVEISKIDVLNDLKETYEATCFTVGGRLLTDIWVSYGDCYHASLCRKLQSTIRLRGEPRPPAFGVHLVGDLGSDDLVPTFVKTASGKHSGGNSGYSYTDVQGIIITPIKLLGCAMLFICGVLIVAISMAGRLGLGVITMIAGFVMAFVGGVLALPL